MSWRCCFQAYLRMGCGIHRTLGDKVAVEKRTKNYITGCADVWGGAT